MAIRNQIEGRGRPQKAAAPQRLTTNRFAAPLTTNTARSGAPGYGFGVVTHSGTPRPAPTRSAPGNAFNAGGGGGGTGGGGGGGGGGIAPMAAPAPPIPSVGDYQASDQILVAALGALDRALKDYNAQYEVDVSNYDRDYNEGLRGLGWNDLDAGEPVNMGWNWSDLLTSSGRAYQNLVNDFANRGMLQSQGYLDAQGLLERSLNDQKGAMDTARTDFLGDLGRRKTEFTNQDTLARQRARAESTARRAAEYGIV